MDVNSPEAAEWSDMMRQISAKDHEIDKLCKLGLELVDALEFIEGVYDRTYDDNPKIAAKARSILEQLGENGK